MTIEAGLATLEPLDKTPSCTEPHSTQAQTAATSMGTKRPGADLAALLDRFTGAITNPQTETIGSFAGTVDELHRELLMLARHFGADAEAAPASDALDFDEIFPEQPIAAIEPPQTGIAQAEELEHLCRELSGN